MSSCNDVSRSHICDVAVHNPQPLAKRLEVEDLRQNGAKDYVRAVGTATVLAAAVESIFIAATKALAKVVVVVALVHIITTIAVVRVLVGIRALIAGVPAILPVCLPRTEAFPIAIVHGLPEQICAVLIRLVVAAATIVTIGRRRIVVGIIVVVVVAVVPEIGLLLLQAAPHILAENGTAPYGVVAAAALSLVLQDVPADQDFAGTASRAVAADLCVAADLVVRDVAVAVCSGPAAAALVAVAACSGPAAAVRRREQ